VPFDLEETMPTAVEPITHREPWRIPAWLGLCLFLAIAAFFLWEEHRAHLLGALPYVLLLLCPVIHLFMRLGCPADRPDMIVGEVKEGAVRLNAAIRDPVVLEVALQPPKSAADRVSGCRSRD
jgi:hypothetical protein